MKFYCNKVSKAHSVLLICASTLSLRACLSSSSSSMSAKSWTVSAGKNLDSVLADLAASKMEATSELAVKTFRDFVCLKNV